jgi:hypothetical protein
MVRFPTQGVLEIARLKAALDHAPKMGDEACAAWRMLAYESGVARGSP